MCGICGIINLTEGPPPDLDLLTRMMGRLRHRGPDSSGYYRDKQVALGHTRLSIIDLETGAQPLSNENDTIWVTFNGEIFNYIELASELIGYKGSILWDSSFPDGTHQKLMDVEKVHSLGWKEEISIREGIKGVYNILKS